MIGEKFFNKFQVVRPGVLFGGTAIFVNHHDRGHFVHGGLIISVVQVFSRLWPETGRAILWMVGQAVCNGPPYRVKILAVRTAVAVMPHNQRDLAFHERIQLGLVELVVVVKIVMVAVVVTVSAPVFFFVCSCSLRLVSLTATVVTVQRLHLGHYTFRQYLIWIVQI
jgi:hypothetical protein